MIEQLINLFIGFNIIGIPMLAFWLILYTEEIISIIKFEYFHEDGLAKFATIIVWYFLSCPIILTILLIINNY